MSIYFFPRDITLPAAYVLKQRRLHHNNVSGGVAQIVIGKTISECTAKMLPINTLKIVEKMFLVYYYHIDVKSYVSFIFL